MAIEGEIVGGNGDHLRVLAEEVAALNPVTAASRNLDTTLLEHAETYAPGLASTAWSKWPETVEPVANLVPGLVSDGNVLDSDGERLPVLVPTVCEAHTLLGDAALLEPTPKYDIPENTPLYQRERAKDEARKDEIAAERKRRAAVAAERSWATIRARNLLVRTVASMAPGSVDITVCDPFRHGADFRDFAPMGRAGLYRVAEHLPDLLQELKTHITFMNSQGLAGAASLRELAETSGDLPTPYRMVVLFGSGDQLGQRDAELLRMVLEQGNACGVNLVIHGMAVDITPDMHRIAALRNGNVRTPAAGQMPYRPHRNPPSRVVAATARAAAGDRPAPPPTVESGPPTPAGDTRLPGQRYAAALRADIAACEQAEAAVAAFRAAHPFLEPTFVQQELIPSEQNYLRYIDLVAIDPRLARADLEMLRDHKTAPLDLAQIWAAFTLASSAAPDMSSRVAQFMHGGDARALTAIHLDNLIDVVAVTAHHGHTHVPEEVRAWVTHALHEDPPAYAFQLVADFGTRRSGLGTTRRQQAAQAATLSHLKSAQGLLPRSGLGSVPDHIRDAVIECELLRLYGFTEPGALDELRTLLTRRAQQRLERVRREDLPPAARPYYDAWQKHIDDIGRVESLREKAAGLGSAMLRRLTGRNDDADGDPVGYES